MDRTTPSVSSNSDDTSPLGNVLLGSDTKMSQLGDDFFGRLQADCDVGFYFANTTGACWGRKFAEICRILCAGELNEGDHQALRAHHANKSITDFQFNRVIEHLQCAIVTAHPQEGIAEQVVERMEMVRADVVQCCPITGARALPGRVCPGRAH